MTHTPEPRETPPMSATRYPPPTCGGCGKFVNVADKRVQWDYEPGEYGEKLSQWPVACPNCPPVVKP